MNENRAATGLWAQAAAANVKYYIYRHKLAVLLAVVAAALAFTAKKPAVFAVLFAAHGLACLLLRPLKKMANLGIELTMLITVLGSFAYGAKTGALMGAAAMLIDYIVSARISLFSPVTITTYALIGLLAGNFASLGITAVGIAAAVAYNLVTSFIIVAFMGGHIDKCLRFGVSNIALNFVLFTTVAPWLLSMLT